jgi:bacteriocin-like protein
MKNLNQQELENINGGGLIDTLVDIAVTLYNALNSDGSPQL